MQRLYPTDKQRGIDAGSNGSLDYYLATVQTATHYYPFGWELVAMQYGAGYRYGYNGMEKSPEIGSGHHTTLFRENDSRSPVWWSIDPKTTAGESPYVMMGGNPVVGTDVLGDTTRVYNTKGQYLNTYYGKGTIEDHFIEQKLYEQINADKRTSEEGKALAVRDKSQYFIGALARGALRRIAERADEEEMERAFVLHYGGYSNTLGKELQVLDITHLAKNRGLDFVSFTNSTFISKELRWENSVKDRVIADAINNECTIGNIVIQGHVHTLAGGAAKVFQWNTKNASSKMRNLNQPTNMVADDYNGVLEYSDLQGNAVFASLATPALIVSKFGYTIYSIREVRTVGNNLVPIQLGTELMIWGYDGKLKERNINDVKDYQKNRNIDGERE
jgi:RHS repeat-associated protein